MIIDKKATDSSRFLVRDIYYKNGRSAMYDLLKQMMKSGMLDTLYLPAYIGWSPKEGSGIYDPIIKLSNLKIDFYKITKKIEIDFNDLKKKVVFINTEKTAVLIVNYFGFYDVNIKKIYDYLKRKGIWIIEDNAHGYYTYMLHRKHFSDATFYSFHKLLPYEDGGALRINNPLLHKLSFKGVKDSSSSAKPWLFDSSAIINQRRMNYNHLIDVIKHSKSDKYFIPLKPKMTNDTVPQTLPIIIKKGNRDIIYELMNKSGYGVISLYHTMIEPINNEGYKNSQYISKRILNLPVHQDVDTLHYKSMIKTLIKYCKMTSSPKGV
ncbi:MAG: DegT/DnrJ/EryC1/StrS family aminotransferase [Vulcanibacillus sp.]